jgi:hypothetical protein
LASRADGISLPRPAISALRLPVLDAPGTRAVPTEVEFVCFPLSDWLSGVPLDTLLGLDHDRFCVRFGAASWIFTVGC